MQTWAPDLLGPGFTSRSLPLSEDDEGPVTATLIRYRDPGRRRPSSRRTARRRDPEQPVVLYVHGWTDYFHQRDLARFWSDRGCAFHALYLRKYGRSLRDGQTPGYVDDLRAYDEDIDAALAAIAADGGAAPSGPLVLMGHSTGGLVASLWAARHPGRVRALVLNSPWLEAHGSALVRTTTTPVLEQLARRRPRTALRLPAVDHYWRTLSDQADGEWELDPRWRPRFSFPVRAGWLRAVVAGQQTVARGLDLDCPALVLTSARSVISPRWNERMRSADCVLDVTTMAQRALDLGPRVTVNRFEGALHDVLLSPARIRAAVYSAMDQWAQAYVFGSAAVAVPVLDPPGADPSPGEATTPAAAPPYRRSRRA
ncbi:hypothetical protein BGP79_15345 [Tersicoccus sp. Bi-70]|nr:hypothetical protein BGP79_15345 [Tersicoccus sp. Bi-70]